MKDKNLGIEMNEISTTPPPSHDLSPNNCDGSLLEMTIGCRPDHDHWLNKPAATGSRHNGSPLKKDDTSPIFVTWNSKKRP